ncbi:dTDP-4-dehydrorhamnose reductase [Sutcliffiella horikoshii]|uniref:dTDP-4-dehydrorhamnose reductase n=1 Tax=Sutcliffiella horikoshii TaxID=79883 RepID=UPI001CFCC708|nr:dTDP-4-dehydrorhamnose reductase [Sutcliffiella horikoshii]
MKILVTGYTGQLGHDVVKQGENIGLTMIGVGSTHFDIAQKEQVLSYVENLQPDAIIHCAAYTAVDNAEDEIEKCNKVNINGTEYLALAAAKSDAKFIYISTDYVFDGKGQEPFKENHIPNPIGTYGKSKFAGELLVQNILHKWFIVRISWVFGQNGNNFIKTMLRLSETKQQLNVVGDQFGSPTYTEDLAKLLINMVQTEKYGIYHASNEGFCNWAEFAEEVFRITGKDVKVTAIASEEYPTRAVRPKNSKMSKQSLDDNGFERLPHWKDAVKRYVTDLTKNEVQSNE